MQTEFSYWTDVIETKVRQEVISAVKKHGDGIPAGRRAFLSILTEEVGEIAKSCNKRDDSQTLEKEIIQTMAVCQMYLSGILKDSDK